MREPETIAPGDVSGHYEELFVASDGDFGAARTPFDEARVVATGNIFVAVSAFLPLPSLRHDVLQTLKNIHSPLMD